jgi:nitrogen fixation protein FixH
MSKQKALHWPYGIALSFVIVIALIVATIMVASDNKVENSDLYMQNYHTADANANEILTAQIAFNKKYTIDFLTEQISTKNSAISYRLKDKLGNPITDALIEVVLTRPNSHAYDMTLKDPTVSVDGVYEFAAVQLPVEGRWDVMAKITIGEDYRYYNLKADTRYSETYEY